MKSQAISSQKNISEGSLLLLWSFNPYHAEYIDATPTSNFQPIRLLDPDG